MQEQSNLLWMLLAAFVTISLFWAFYEFWYKPRRLHQWYVEILQGMGYRVKVHPFTTFGGGPYQDIMRQAQVNGDPMNGYKKMGGKYDVGVFNILNKVTIQLYQADLIKAFCQPENPYLYHKLPILIDNIKRSLGQGIAFSEENQWKRKRKIMNAVFNYDFIQLNIPKIIRLCNQNFERNQEEYLKKQQTEGSKNIVQLDILQLFSCIYSNVMMECFFGVSSIYQKIDGMIVAMFLNKLNGDISEQGMKPLALILGTKFLKLGLRQEDRDINRRIKILRALAKQKIQLRMKEIEKNGAKQNFTDILQALVYNKKISLSNTKDDANYHYEQLVEEFCTFYTAGTDTTSHLTQMMIYYISMYPQIEKRLREQIAKHIKSDEDITSQNLKKMTYVDWIQNETTRYYGPGNGIFVRKVMKDHNLGKIPMRTGTCIGYQPVPNHFNPAFFKNPQQFRPQRWQTETQNLHPYALFGFSGGPRTCIGKHLALLQSKIALIKFVMRYKSFKLPKEKFKIYAKFVGEPQFMLTKVELKQ